MRAVIYGLCLYAMGATLGRVLQWAVARKHFGELEACAILINLMLSGIHLYLLFQACSGGQWR